MSRLYLSPPTVGPRERELLLDAFDSNWIAPLGPHVDAFEAEVAAIVGVRAAAALSSGTAALHLALLAAGVGSGDDVLVPTLTFAATANAVAYLGARPVFVDADPASWNLDTALLDAELAARAGAGRLPAAVVAVDLYGQCADWDRIEASCAAYEVPLVEDAAEALGATYRGRAAGSFGQSAVLSFNGNKIVTCGGGGMLVSDDEELVGRARYLASQARQPVAHYEHVEVGFNYRLSNLLAAVGRGQVAELDDHIARRQETRRHYTELLAGQPGIELMPLDPAGEPNCWLTCITVDAERFGADREQLRLHLETLDIESRPLWKPLHLQPAFADAPRVGGAVAEALFERGLCLPSGSALTADDRARVVEGLSAARP